jgi:hypothetical protein
MAAMTGICRAEIQFIVRLVQKDKEAGIEKEQRHMGL